MSTWPPLRRGYYGDAAVETSKGYWFARDPNFDPSPVLGRPLKCLRYYRQEFGEHGVTEERILVAEDNTFKDD